MALTKKQRKSSRSYNYRQSIARTHFNRTPQIFKKEIHADKTFLTAIANFFMKFGRRNKGDK